MKLLISLLLFASIARANPFQYSWQELAPGVWAAIRQDPFELPQEGNAVFVVTDQGVVLFDAGGSPRMGESIVAKVRSVTDKPVTHVVLSHWHGDHMRGLQSIQAAFPHVAILAHPFARDFISSTQDRWLKRRVSMVPNIRKNVGAMLKNDLIPEEKRWLLNGLQATEELDRENNRTTFVVPNATFTDRLTLHLGTREIQFLHLGNAHTAGDIIMWLPQERIVATGDIVTAPIPLMPSAYTRDYAEVLAKIKALEFRTLVPGHGLVQHDAAYLGLLTDLLRVVTSQMKSLTGMTKEEAIAKIDFSSVENRFTHGDAFLANRLHDYVSIGLPAAAYDVEKGVEMKEVF
ncbi:MAG TPA: MBL fold metallo-hydrolase [Thermoanaerobaculia bacterium]|nr:MBL fold metallo-hydrolase [Thermoanaerobaculia bacterium]